MANSVAAKPAGYTGIEVHETASGPIWSGVRAFAHVRLIKPATPAPA